MPRYHLFFWVPLIYRYRSRSSLIYDRSGCTVHVLPLRIAAHTAALHRTAGYPGCFSAVYLPFCRSALPDCLICLGPGLDGSLRWLHYGCRACVLQLPHGLIPRSSGLRFATFGLRCWLGLPALVQHYCWFCWVALPRWFTCLVASSGSAHLPGFFAVLRAYALYFHTATPYNRSAITHSLLRRSHTAAYLLRAVCDALLALVARRALPRVDVDDLAAPLHNSPRAML